MRNKQVKIIDKNGRKCYDFVNNLGEGVETVKLKAIRLSNKMTQDDIAEALGVSRSTVAMWETGKALPRADKLIELAKLFNCTIDDLLKD